MNPEAPGVLIDGMQSHPDWNRVETLSIHPDCDTLVIVPGHALFKSGVDVNSPTFNPLLTDFWSLNEFQDAYEVSLLVEHIHTGVVTAAKEPHSVLVFSGGCTRPAGEGWTEGGSYYEVAEHYNWWKDETGIDAHGMRSKTFVDVYSYDSMDNLWMSIKLFQMAHPRREVPKRVIVVGCDFKRERFGKHASDFGIPEFEYIGMENPLNIDDEARKRERAVIECYSADPMGENFESVVWKKKFKRNFLGVEYPYGSAKDVRNSYVKQFDRRHL